MTVKTPIKKLPKPLPLPLMCAKCGYDTDYEGYCCFCGHVTR